MMIASRNDHDAEKHTKDLVALLSRESNSELERMAPRIADQLTHTVTGNTIRALLSIGQHVFEEHHMAVWAIQFYKEAIAQSERIRDQRLIAWSKKNLAVVYTAQDLLPEALKYSYESSLAYEQIQDYTNATRLFYNCASINYRSGNLANSITDFDSFLKYFGKLPPDSVSADLRFSLMSGWNTMGLAHRKMSNFGKSSEAFQKALQLAKESQNQFWIALVNGNKGNTLFVMGKPKEAIPFAQEDMRISLASRQYTSAGFACILLAEMQVALNNVTQAKILLDSVPFFLRHAETDKHQLRRSFARVQAKFFALTKQFEQAHEALLLQVRLDDSIRNEERFVQLAQIQAGYDLEKKENEIRLLGKNNELQQKEIVTQRYLISGAILLGVLGIAFLVYFFVSYHKVKRQKEIIELQREDIEEKNSELEAQSSTLLHQNEIIRSSNLSLETKVMERTSQLHETIKELDTFLYHASHDIRRPIATLLGLENVARAEQNENELFKHVATTARDMDSMLSKLQMAYRINQPIDDLTSVDLGNLVLATSNKFDDQFKQSGMDFSFAGKDSKVTTSPSLLQVAFQNVIENAIQFRNSENSWVRVSVEENENHVDVLFQDNGIGIEEKHQARIFDLYYRGTDRSKGNGLGLYLTKKSLQKINADITVTSRFGKGTTFKVSIPRKG
ncbi:MAG TPA: HAMP domain-containing sensor histidine kinase [Cyclobacteriaceae bacterium]|jgi:signal transduction histidine kinase|nr:HAMP domain-containing sensor histidine kinase [Cyclobacteriaceae bacterium]